MQRLTKLENSFHNTTCSVSTRQWGSDPKDAWFLITGCAFAQHDQKAKKVYRRVWKALCGIEGCTCGVVR